MQVIPLLLAHLPHLEDAGVDREVAEVDLSGASGGGTCPGALRTIYSRYSPGIIPALHFWISPLKRAQIPIVEALFRSSKTPRLYALRAELSRLYPNPGALH